METGHYISGIGHLGIVGWALFGGMFNAEPLPFEVQDVAVISEAEFQAMIAQDTPPDTTETVPEPVAPVEEESPTLPQPPEKTEPETPTAPERAETATPDPTPEVEPTPPVEPEPVEPPTQIEEPAQSVAVVLPERSIRPRPRPAPRVAPEPVALPEPETDTSPDQTPETTPEESPDTPVEDSEASQPEEATTEIVTEAEEPPSGAPTAATRPRSRPERPTATATEQTDDAENESSSVDNAVAAALKESQTEPAAPSGPPMSRREREGLRLAVQDCWVVDVGSQSANVTVTVAFAMGQDGKVAGPIKLVASKGGTGAAVDVAFQAARRAVLRCQKGGYDLPVEKYDHWKEVEITFNPENMRLR